MSDDGEERVARARQRVETATRAARDARIAAAEPLRARARRRSRMVRLGLVAASVLAVILAVTAVVVGLGLRAADQRSADRTEVLTSARTAITTMLTSDPARAEEYVDAVLAVSAGTQRERLAAARGPLTAEIARGPRGTGEVLSAGIVGESSDDEATVLVVAEATNPGLVGGDRAGTRVTLRVEMTRTADGWRVGQAVLA